MMHQRYAGFTEDLIPKLAAPFREDPPEDDKEALRKRRTNLRYAQMIVSVHADALK